MVTSRRLVIVRHARAEPHAASDVERDLTDGGRLDAAELGRWLAGQGIVPGVAHVSYAARTRQTYDVLAGAAGWDLAPQVDGGLYATDEAGVLELVRVTGEEVDTVLVVGHNPTMAMLVQLLDDGEGPATGAVGMELPTAGAAVFEVDGPWDEVGALSGRLVAHHVGRADTH